MADDVIVMYLGKIVERAPTRDIFYNPLHPYTQGLLKSIPSLASKVKKRLIPIKGDVPDVFGVPRGCGFEPRCSQAMEICKTKIPPIREEAPGHMIACWMHK